VRDRGHLPTEGRNPESVDLDTLSPGEIVDLMNRQDRQVVEAVAAQKDAIVRAVECVVRSFRSGGRLIYVGAGTSGRLGVVDAAECPPSFHVPREMVQGIIAGFPDALWRAVEQIEDLPEAGAEAVAERQIGSDDTVMGIATGGTTPFVGGALREAKRRGAATVFFTCCPGLPLAHEVDVAIVPETGPEIITGSTRMKAGTATKLVLNTITTSAMVQLGKTYGNLMVDLRVLNDKLQDRAERILMAACGIEREQATALLERSDGRVKIGIVMHKLGVDAPKAEALIAEHGGHIRPLVGDPPPM